MKLNEAQTMALNRAFAGRKTLVVDTGKARSDPASFADLSQLMGMVAMGYLSVEQLSATRFLYSIRPKPIVRPTWR